MVCLGDFAPVDRQKRYMYIQLLKDGLSKPCVLCTYSVGGPVGNYLFLWSLPPHVTMEAAMQENHLLIAKVQADAPAYHHRYLRKQLISKFGLISRSSNLSLLREFYRQATGDQSASLTTTEKEMDARLREALEMEDPELLIDLRGNNGCKGNRFESFWEKMKIYLNESTAVQDRRHGLVTYMAKAISVRDLIDEVSKMCPSEPIPSEQWVRLQFFPKNSRAKTASQYKSQFPVKMMVQKRQFRREHMDSHYCAALFRYMREYAITYRALSSFVCLDDKHRIKCGEPGYPVAAAERGRRVVVSTNESFEVGDHDFCKFSIIPSVSLLIDTPESIECSWYEGKVYVAYKDAVHEPSSPIRHATELHSILLQQIDSKSALFVYTDSGPDHRLTYLSVQLSLIALFHNLNLDLLIAGRTAPCHSWKNPVECIMSIVNLGLQCVGIMRKEGSNDFERSVKNANNLEAVRKATSKSKEEVRESLKPPLQFLRDITSRLKLKGESFILVESADDQEIEDFWEVLLLIEDSLQQSDSAKAILSSRPKLKEFLEHCCQLRHYSFCIKKCGNDSCTICLPVRMDATLFSALRFLPDPLLGEDGHYLLLVTSLAKLPQRRIVRH